LLWTGKTKTKPKDFAMCVAEGKRWFAPVLFIAKTLPTILSNITKQKSSFTNLRLKKEFQQPNFVIHD
tara:strand:+ start:333 stop:536 length:204 start_codon:yes stop_codon:yes gene_type:complete